jgi:hypothetical protein
MAAFPEPNPESGAGPILADETGIPSAHSKTGERRRVRQPLRRDRPLLALLDRVRAERCPAFQADFEAEANLIAAQNAECPESEDYCDWPEDELDPDEELEDAEGNDPQPEDGPDLDDDSDPADRPEPDTRCGQRMSRNRRTRTPKRRKATPSRRVPPSPTISRENLPRPPTSRIQTARRSEMMGRTQTTTRCPTTSRIQTTTEGRSTTTPKPVSPASPMLACWGGRLLLACWGGRDVRVRRRPCELPRAPARIRPARQRRGNP